MNKLQSRLAITVLLVAAAAAPASADFRLERELALDPGGRFELHADAGSVVVTGGRDSGVRVLVTAARDDIDERLEFSFDESPGVARVRAEKKGSGVGRWFGWGRDRLRFEIQVPGRSDVRVRTAGGGIEVSTLAGEVGASTSGGSIQVRDVAGDVDLSTSGGGIRAERVDGAVEADTSGGSIRIAAVTGDVDADTSGGSITVEDVGGRIRADTSGGSITARFTPGNDRGGVLSTSGGSVTAYVDPAVGLDLHASTSGGGVHVDVPITVAGKVERSSVKGSLNGGGETLRLSSSGGSIRVKSL